MKKSYTFAEAICVGEKVGVNFKEVDMNEFIVGLGIELKHDSTGLPVNDSNDDLEQAAKTAWVHLKELPDYYTRLTVAKHRGESRMKVAHGH